MSVRARVFYGDCLDVLARLPDACFDSIVTDPPYGLEFMGVAWDTFSARLEGSPRACSEWSDSGSREHPRKASEAAHVQRKKNLYYEFSLAWAAEAFRVIKPGGYLLAFGGTRTYHRMACAIEDAGFEVRDSLHWIFGNGFPKNRDTALKPSHEPVILARKPMIGAIATNVLTYGTGTLNIDGCRVGPDADTRRSKGRNPSSPGAFPHSDDAWVPHLAESGSATGGRWPPDILLTHSADCRPAGTRRVKGITGGTGHHKNSIYGKLSYDEGESVKDYAGADGMETVQAWDCAEGCPVAGMDAQSGVLTSGANPARRSSDKFREAYGKFAGQRECVVHRGTDSGGASRFFPQFAWDPEYDLPFLYCAKAPKKERPVVEGVPGHPTVKPLALMRWLVRLVTPPGGTVLDLFAGTGTTVQACLDEWLRCVAIENDPDSIRRIRARLRDYADVRYSDLVPAAGQEDAG